MARTRYRVRTGDWTPHFITCGTADRTRLFAGETERRILTDSLRFLSGEGVLEVHAYAVLLDHLHAVCSAEDLNSQMRRFKSYTARRLVDHFKLQQDEAVLTRLRLARREHMIQQTHQVWEQGFHPKDVGIPVVMQQKIDYIHTNPVRHGLVDAPEDWTFSSCRFYRGLIDQDPHIPIKPLHLR